MWAFLLLLCLSCVLADLQHTKKAIPDQKTDVYAVHLKEGANADKMAAEHGFKNLGQVGELKGIYRFQKLLKRSRNVRDIRTHPKLLFSERQVKRQRYPRMLETIQDPLWYKQWDLHDNGVSLNVQNVWRINITGQGTQVAVVDDGVESTHIDLQGNYNSNGSYDVNHHRPSPNPYSWDSHGTSAAGCVAAKANNNACGVGTAPNAKVAGIRLISEATTDVDEAEGLSYKTGVNQIMSSSWGPMDDGRRLEGPGRVLQLAFKTQAEQGRQGKGTIFMWAAGNGRGARDNCNYDGYANNRYTIPVGAIVSGGRHSWYSEPCAKLFCVVPSSGTPGMGVPTINLRNSCTSTFGGTSAAAPLMAGVVALMLEANPALTYRDVMHVIAKSAIKTDITSSDWTTNGGGYHHNHDYGFGRIDALKTVNLAKNWVNVPPVQEFVGNRVSVNRPIRVGSVTSFSYTVTSPIDFVEHVSLTFQASHPHRGQVEVYLISPSGTKSVLASRHSDSARNYPSQGWTFGTVRNWGERAAGMWTVQCMDSLNNGSKGTFNWFQLSIFGYKKN